MKKMSKGMLMTALICGAVYLGGSPVYASELQEFSLDEYVVTAARMETKLVDTPANISVVDAQTIEERHYQDVSEVLKDVPGVAVVDTGVGSFEKAVKLNGDERVLILVDGRRISTDIGLTNSARASTDMNQLPDVNMIERIEVLKGAGGSLYGSEAVGGVINIITKKASADYGKVSLGFGSNDSRDFNAMYSFKENKTGIVVSGSKTEQDYYKYRDAKTDSSKRWPGNSDYENNKVSIKINQEITSSSNLSVGYDYSKFKGTNFGNLNSSWSAESKLDKQTDHMYARYDWTLKGIDTGYLQIYHNEYEYNNYSPGNEGFFDEKTNGLDLQQVISLSDSNKLVVGSSWRKSDVEATGPNIYSNKYNENIENLAFFLNDTLEIAPTWTLNAGIRYDDHSEAGDETTFSAGLNKKFDDNSHAYINWGQVFRAPTSDDLFQSGGGMYGNPNLNAETGDTWTVGYSTKINENTGAGINFFESDLEDAIDWEPIIPGDYYGDWTARNIQKQKKRGMELSLNHEFNDNLELTASYTYLRVKNLSGNVYLKDENIIPNMYRVGIRYQDGKWNANANLRYGSGASQNSYLDSSYLTVDCAVTYEARKNLSLYIKGYNLFNEAYAELAGTTNGSYNYPAQSRRFIVGAEYKF